MDNKHVTQHCSIDRKQKIKSGSFQSGYRHRARPSGSEESHLCVLSSSPLVRSPSSTEHPECPDQMMRTADRPPDKMENNDNKGE